jgi:hypothetical protein
LEPPALPVVFFIQEITPMLERISVNWERFVESRDEKVIRYMTVKLDKYAAAYAEKRRAKLGKKEEA